MKLVCVHELHEGGGTSEHLIIAACKNDACDRLRLAVGCIRKDLIIVDEYPITMGVVCSREIEA